MFYKHCKNCILSKFSDSFNNSVNKIVHFRGLQKTTGLKKLRRRHNYLFIFWMFITSFSSWIIFYFLNIFPQILGFFFFSVAFSLLHQRISPLQLKILALSAGLSGVLSLVIGCSGVFIFCSTDLCPQTTGSSKWYSLTYWLFWSGIKRKLQISRRFHVHVHMK